MRKLSVMIALAIVFCFSGAANAVDITLDVISANWTNVVSTAGGSTGISFYNLDGLTGNEEIRWGVPVSGLGQSGYKFDSAAPPSFTVASGTSFSLGDFTHNNFPVFDPVLVSAQLNITANLTINGTPSAEGPFTFSFLHNETPNIYGDSGDNDLVNFSNLVSSDTFIVDGQTLTLELLGFQQGSVFTNLFSTIEGQANTAQLIGIFREPTTAIPEPSMMLLVGSGLAGLVGYGRRRFKK